MFSIIKNVFRAKQWWNFIIPPVVGFVYFIGIFSEYSIPEFTKIICMVFLSAIAMAMFGFFLNDITDIELDKIAGKQNFTSSTSKAEKMGIIIFTLTLATIPWFIINSSIISKILIGLQIILLALYSIPPIRLKRFSICCITFDSFYSGLIFIFAIIFINPKVIESMQYPLWSLLFLGLTLLLRGLRNIGLHQISDAENDIKVGISNICSFLGKTKVLQLLVYLVLPLELLALFLFSRYISFSLPKFYIVFIVAILYLIFHKYYQVFRLKNTNNDEEKTEINRINIIYEDILPLAFLTYLTLSNYKFIVFLLVHIIIFSNYFLGYVYGKIIRPFFVDFVYIIILYRFMYAFLYRKVIMWLYYKSFHNEYTKQFVAFCKKTYNNKIKTFTKNIVYLLKIKRR